MKRRLARSLERFSVRLVPTNDIHLTLVPPWNEASIPTAVEKLRAVTDRFGAFTLIFRRLAYGLQPRRPRLLWAECAATDDITLLRAALLRRFDQSDDRPFRPHVTLARIRGNGSAIAGDSRLIRNYHSRSRLARSNSFNRLLPVEAVIRSSPPCDWATKRMRRRTRKR